MEEHSNSWERYLLSRWNNGKLILSQPKFTIGRGLKNTYVLEDIQVSRNHCIFEEVNGSWYLTDQSCNGTTLNKTKIPFQTRTILSNGDVIKLTDKHEFVFVNINKNSLDDIDLSVIIEEADSINQVIDLCSSNNDFSSEITSTTSENNKISNVVNEHTYCINVNNGTSNCTNTNINQDCINIIETSTNVKSFVSDSNDANKEEASNSGKNQTNEEPTDKQSTNTGMDVLVEAENELQCIICTELFINATTLNCSHSFCKSCIEQWRKKNKFCPICRVKITTANPTLVLDNFIAKIMESSPDDIKAKRQEVIKSREQPQPKTPSTTTTRSRRVRRSRVTTSPIQISSEEESSSNDDSYDDDDYEDFVDLVMDAVDYDYTGVPGHYYGGYGSCFNCGRRGHWANGCPYR